MTLAVQLIVSLVAAVNCAVWLEAGATLDRVAVPRDEVQEMLVMRTGVTTGTTGTGVGGGGGIGVGTTG